MNTRIRLLDTPSQILNTEDQIIYSEVESIDDIYRQFVVCLGWHCGAFFITSLYIRDHSGHVTDGYVITLVTLPMGT